MREKSGERRAREGGREMGDAWNAEAGEEREKRENDWGEGERSRTTILVSTCAGFVTAGATAAIAAAI